METVAQQRAGAQRSGTSPLYQVLAEDIVAMGVEAAFGLISDDTALLATALDTSGARFYGARHENCAIAMADGYAYAAGRLGVAVIGRGPALANGLHGAIYASRTGSPVLPWGRGRRPMSVGGSMAAPESHGVVKGYRDQHT
jgi:acetolactate synthase I/II/III large subunit